MRRIFELAKVSKFQVDVLQQHLIRREVSLTSQVSQARSAKGSGGDKDSGSTRKRSADRKGKSPRSPFSSSRSSKKKSSPSYSSRPKPRSGSTTTKRGLSTERMEKTSVRQDKAANKFILDLGNNQEARIDYRPIGKNKLELYHSEVPSELRGRGIGKALARGAFELAANNKTKLRLTCSYLEDYMEKFGEPEFKRLVEK